MLPDGIFGVAQDAPRGTASESIAVALRTAILQGTLSAGRPLPQSELATGFGVSIIPVREALKRLEAEGLVSFLPNRGATVAGMSDADIIEYSNIRAVLEEQAIRHAVPRMGRVDLARIEDAYEAFVEGSHGNDGMICSGQLNRDFHNAIYVPAARPRLLEMIDDLHRRLDRYIRSHLVIEGRKVDTDGEHLAILEACRHGDVEEAARLTRQHILHAAEISLQFLRK